MLDVSDPAAPVETGFHDTGDIAQGLAVSDSMIYVGDGYDGVYILKKSFPTGVQQHGAHPVAGKMLYTNYPNPFNAQTAIEYNVPESRHVRVDIFNISGQKIQTLVNQRQPAGRHKVIWNGTTNTGESASSGVYLIKLNSGSTTRQKKVTLIK